MSNNLCYNCFHEVLSEDVPCAFCGYDQKQERDKYPLALPHGSILNGRYILGRILGQGGFGITYVAQDWKTKKRVAVKEYLPDAICTRMGTYSVTAYSGQQDDSFQYGKECFLKEAQTLAEFINTPNIVKIHCYFEENGTAYFVMDYVEGISFQQYIQQQGGKIGWQKAEEILFPVMEALSVIHKKGIIHRDVTPDNILITKDGTVKLLDFGAARYSLGDKSRSLDVVLKHGYAPKEQYTRHGKQGSYTDVYSVAASFYYAVTGRRPPDSIDRIEEDDLVAPASFGIEIPEYVEDALFKGLAVLPAERFQSMELFKKALENKETESVPMPEPFSEPITGQRAGSGQVRKISIPKWVMPLALSLMAFLVIMAVVIIKINSPKDVQTKQTDANILVDEGPFRRMESAESFNGNSTEEAGDEAAGGEESGAMEENSEEYGTVEPDEDTGETARFYKETAFYEDYVLPESDCRNYSKVELRRYNADQLKIARNEIYARHGRRFLDEELQEYFDNCSWYYGTIEPDEFDQESIFNQYEKENVLLIKECELELEN